jgi:hypothetical protein
VNALVPKGRRRVASPWEENNKFHQSPKLATLTSAAPSGLPRKKTPSSSFPGTDAPGYILPPLRGLKVVGEL